MPERSIGWDPIKAQRNLAKHGVSFEDAANALEDVYARVLRDEFHSADEDRFILVGDSGSAGILTVIFAIREDAARIISARPASKKEMMRYMGDSSTIHDGEEMLEEYGDREGWAPNPFRFRRPGTVVLDPDVAAVFRSAEEVNDALRSLLKHRRASGNKKSK